MLSGHFRWVLENRSSSAVHCASAGRESSSRLLTRELVSQRPGLNNVRMKGGQAWHETGQAGRALTRLPRTVPVRLPIDLVSTWPGARSLISNNDRIVSVGLHMFFEILRSLEGFATEFASVRLQWNVNANMGRDVIAFDDRDVAVAPCTLQIEIVCALAAYMAVAHVFLHPAVSLSSFQWWDHQGAYIKRFRAGRSFTASLPLALKRIVDARSNRWRLRLGCRSLWLSLILLGVG